MNLSQVVCVVVDSLSYGGFYLNRNQIGFNGQMKVLGAVFLDLKGKFF